MLIVGAVVCFPGAKVYRACGSVYALYIYIRFDVCGVVIVAECSLFILFVCCMPCEILECVFGML